MSAFPDENSASGNRICVTCGVAQPVAAALDGECRTCLDERQWVPAEGQLWTTHAELAEDHSSEFAEIEPGLVEIRTDPGFAIGQRALHVGPERLLWDCVSLADEASAERVEELGGVDVIAISHPHFHASMNRWAELLDARILLHAADREHVLDPGPRIELWDGERLELGSDGLELVRLGGHFSGATVCLWPAGAEGRGSLLCSDVIQLVNDPGWVSFMRSYPNLIPLPARGVERIAARAAELGFDRLHGGWSEKTIEHGGREAVARSARRYVEALGETGD
ncbi:MBL fold metallo-hydrolase [Thermoleophilia bacterium SCSIO 60948]|nr:MBL fold metallo-hydrolase [Thermoleophilia bacterium SCSIO 60948]